MTRTTVQNVSELVRRHPSDNRTDNGGSLDPLVRCPVLASDNGGSSRTCPGCGATFEAVHRRGSSANQPAEPGISGAASECCRGSLNSTTREGAAMSYPVPRDGTSHRTRAQQAFHDEHSEH